MINYNLCILLAFLVVACIYIPIDGYSVDSFSDDNTVNPSNIAFSNDGTKMFILASNTVFEYSLPTPFDIITSTFTHSFLIGNQDIIHGVTFSNDGTKMFAVGSQYNKVHEYTLSTPYNVTSSTFSRSFELSENRLQVKDIVFSNDGTKMFVSGVLTGIREYTLTAPFDITNFTLEFMRN